MTETVVATFAAPKAADDAIQDLESARIPSAVVQCRTPDEATLADAAHPDATLPDATLPDATLPDATLPDKAKHPEASEKKPTSVTVEVDEVHAPAVAGIMQQYGDLRTK